MVAARKSTESGLQADSFARTAIAPIFVFGIAISSNLAPNGEELMFAIEGNRVENLCVDAPEEKQPEHRNLRAWGKVFLIGATLVLLTAGVITVFNSYRDGRHEPGASPEGGQLDTDEDGLSDEVEVAGWRTTSNELIRTDPHSPDTDSDGLSDGYEAGEKTVDARSHDVIYRWEANPTQRDSDHDGIDDGDEVRHDIDPISNDTDGDGSRDLAEVKCGSDPTVDNIDRDNYDDKQECKRDSDPLAYDLDRSEAVHATTAGFLFGDSAWGARNAARVNRAQLESPEYLAGQLASGYIAIGDLRDLLANVAQGEFIAASISAVALAPVAGDTAKTIATLHEYANRGDRALKSALSVVEKLPISEARKMVVRRTVVGAGLRLPAELVVPKSAPTNYVVYKGVSPDGTGTYVGITNDFDRRNRDHLRNGRAFSIEPIEGARGLTRNEARAIEEFCISQGGAMLENQRHSIRPSLPYYNDALAFGEAYLKRNGSACPASP